MVCHCIARTRSFGWKMFLWGRGGGALSVMDGQGSDGRSGGEGEALRQTEKRGESEREREVVARRRGKRVGLGLFVFRGVGDGRLGNAAQRPVDSFSQCQ